MSSFVISCSLLTVSLLRFYQMMLILRANKEHDVVLALLGSSDRICQQSALWKHNVHIDSRSFALFRIVLFVRPSVISIFAT